MKNVGIKKFKVRSWRPIAFPLILLSISAVPSAQKAGVLCLSTLLMKKEFKKVKVNIDCLVEFMILQPLNDFLYYSYFSRRQTESSIGSAPYRLLRTVSVQLSVNRKFPIHPVNCVYYANIQTYCQFKSTAEIHFFSGYFGSFFNQVFLIQSWCYEVWYLSFDSLKFWSKSFNTYKLNRLRAETDSVSKSVSLTSLSYSLWSRSFRVGSRTKLDTGITAKYCTRPIVWSRIGLSILHLFLVISYIFIAISWSSYRQN